MKRLLVLLACLTSTMAFGEVRYVDDQLVITMRSGQGNRFQILKTLPSGTRLEILTVDGEFARARTADGTEGWVRTQYLTAEPVARDRIAAVEERLARLADEKRALVEQVTTLRAENKELEAAKTRLERDNESMQAKLKRLEEVAARPVELERENAELKTSVDGFENEVELLKKQAVELRDRSYRDWFLTGAGVLLTGLFLGLLLPKMRRKNSGWGDLR